MRFGSSEQSQVSISIRVQLVRLDRNLHRACGQLLASPFRSMTDLWTFHAQPVVRIRDERQRESIRDPNVFAFLCKYLTSTGCFLRIPADRNGKRDNFR